MRQINTTVMETSYKHVWARVLPSPNGMKLELLESEPNNVDWFELMDVTRKSYDELVGQILIHKNISTKKGVGIPKGDDKNNKIYLQIIYDEDTEDKSKVVQELEKDITLIVHKTNN